ncbi:ATP-grasp domain-containing protein [Dactylosporangium sp. CS-033363]|uniref:ATP-grasp domain-containing protein n=1 Tax=Dactylosporangium sp. CS-033363 TaxID=3239935 RepID=UPI003D8C131F
MRVALVTSAGFPEPLWKDSDSPLVAARLQALGAETAQPAWDGPAHDWTAYDVLVLQSPWSMWPKLSQFQTWLHARVLEGALVLNPPSVVELGSDKTYLLRLAALGVPTVPTFLSSGAPDLDALRSLFPPPGSPRRTVVAKPLSSGGALGAVEFGLDDLSGLAAHLSGVGTALVQPYQSAIDVHRELAVLTLDGAVSHAITKAAILRPGTSERLFHPDPRAYGPLSDEQRTVVAETYAALLSLLPADSAPPLSVRLDFILDPDAPRGMSLLEIEAVAPVKFFASFPDECDRYARAILARVGIAR